MLRGERERRGGGTAVQGRGSREGGKGRAVRGGVKLLLGLDVATLASPMTYSDQMNRYGHHPSPSRSPLPLPLPPMVSSSSERNNTHAIGDLHRESHVFLVHCHTHAQFHNCVLVGCLQVCQPLPLGLHNSHTYTEDGESKIRWKFRGESCRPLRRIQCTRSCIYVPSVGRAASGAHQQTQTTAGTPPLLCV